MHRSRPLPCGVSASISPGGRSVHRAQVLLKALPRCAELVSDSREFAQRKGSASEGHSPPCLPFAALSSQYKQTSPTFVVKLVKSYSSASPALSFKRKRNTAHGSLSLPWRGRSVWHHFTPPGLWALFGPRPFHTPLVIKNFHFPSQVSPTCCSSWAWKLLILGLGLC